MVVALQRLYRRLVSLVRRDELTAELEEEMRLHVGRRRDRLIAEGWTPRDAEHEARRRFGSTLTMTERTHDAWGARTLDALVHDCRYAFRGLMRTPGASAMIVVTLALGLGVNAAVLSLLDRLFVRPPAGVESPGDVRRVYLTHDWGQPGFTTATFNNPQWLDIHSATGSSLPMAVYWTDTMLVGQDASSRRVVGYTDAKFWPLLGVRAARGRTFDSTETSFTTPAAIAIVSDAYWHANLDARENALGSTVRVAGVRYTIVGVTPPRFSGVDLDRVDIWLPLGALPVPHFGERQWYESRSTPMLQILVREPRAERLSAAAKQWTAAFRAGSVPAGYSRDTSAVISTGPILAALGPGEAHQEIRITTRLAWVALFVLLIACANVANLLVVRSLERRREIAVRLAMGVSRRRLASQMLVESALLAGIASVGAIAAGAWAAAGLRRLLLPDVHWDDGLIDGRLAAATAVVAAIVAAAICIAPLVQTRRIDIAETLKGVASGPSSRRGRNGFIIVQTAFATLLLCGAALFVQSLRRVAEIKVGYDAPRVLTASPYFTDARGGEDDARARELSDRLPEVADRLARQPGIAGVALASNGPMRGYAMTAIRVPGRDSMPRLNLLGPSLRGVSPGYWNVVGLHVVRGRLLNEDDRLGSRLAIVVNETMARTVWPGLDPLAQCVYPFGIDDSCYAVVGVVSDAHQSFLVEEPTMQAFLALDQVSAKGHRFRASAIAVRAVSEDGTAAAAIVRRAFLETLPEVEPNVQWLADKLSAQVRPWRLGMLLFSALGILALVVAAIGIYSVLAYSVSRRTREIGVRMALGAHRGAVMRLVAGEGARVVAVGAMVGVGIAILSAPAIASLLYGTSPRDPVILGLMAGVMLMAALVASFVPAWRAGTVDPTVAMRSE